MLQFDANANAHANVDARVNEALVLPLNPYFGDVCPESILCRLQMMNFSQDHSGVTPNTSWWIHGGLMLCPCQLFKLWCKVYPVPVACVGSDDPVRVLRLYTTNTLDEVWSIYCWDICTTCRYQIYVLLYWLLVRNSTRRLTMCEWAECSRTVLYGALYSCLCRR